MEPKEIYSNLRGKIIQLELKPESVLNASELAEKYGVSRTPIKEALLTLTAEGWAIRRGAHFIVTPLSLDRIRELTEIRMVMEPQANVWAMQRITPAEIEQAREIVTEASSLGEAADTQAIVDLDFRFHRHLFRAARNHQMARLLERLLSHYLRFWLSVPRSIDPRVFFAEGHELFRAIENRQEDVVRELSRKHIRNSVAEIMGTR